MPTELLVLGMACDLGVKGSETGGDLCFAVFLGAPFLLGAWAALLDFFAGRVRTRFSSSSSSIFSVPHWLAWSEPVERKSVDNHLPFSQQQRQSMLRITVIYW